MKCAKCKCGIWKQDSKKRSDGSRVCLNCFYKEQRKLDAFNTDTSTTPANTTPLKDNKKTGNNRLK